MVDAGKIQSFADRILALKAEEDEVKKQIREVYGEAVEAEVDKTGLGQLVTHLRKRGKSPEDFDAKEAIFLGYLELYNVALARTHAYARARTGEIIESNTATTAAASERSAAPQAALLATQSTAALTEGPGKTKARDALAQIGDDPVKAAQPPVSQEAAFASTGDSIRTRVPEVSSPAGTQAPPVDTNSKAHSSAPALEQALHHSRTDAARVTHSGDGEGQGVRGAGVAANSETREGESGAMPVMAGEPAGEVAGGGLLGLPTIESASPVVARPDGCLNPDVCASSSWRHLCHSCAKANLVPVGVTIGAADIPHQGTVG